MGFLAIEGLSIQYGPKLYTDFEKSPFAGPPDPGVDKAWHDLLAKTSLRVSGSELAQSNQTSVALPEGGGFMAWLGAYHQLHCIVSHHQRSWVGLVRVHLQSTEDAAAMELPRTLPSQYHRE